MFNALLVSLALCLPLGTEFQCASNATLRPFEQKVYTFAHRMNGCPDFQVIQEIAPVGVVTQLVGYDCQLIRFGVYNTGPRRVKGRVEFWYRRK